MYLFCRSRVWNPSYRNTYLKYKTSAWDTADHFHTCRPIVTSLQAKHKFRQLLLFLLFYLGGGVNTWMRGSDILVGYQKWKFFLKCVPDSKPHVSHEAKTFVGPFCWKCKIQPRPLHLQQVYLSKLGNPGPGCFMISMDITHISEDTNLPLLLKLIPDDFKTVGVLNVIWTGLDQLNTHQERNTPSLPFALTWSLVRTHTLGKLRSSHKKNLERDYTIDDTTPHVTFSQTQGNQDTCVAACLRSIVHSIEAGGLWGWQTLPAFGAQ